MKGMVNKMKKKSEFYVERLPRILYAVGTALSVIFLAVNLFIRPRAAFIAISIALFVVGLVLGAVYIWFVSKKVTSRRNYIDINSSMRVSWIVCLVCVGLSAFQLTWLYYLTVLLCGMFVAFFFKYLPRYIQITSEIAKANS